ncbi:MAG: alpha/beta fold hydrolase [Proteobacteria bacterium]|nr:alpha/beta fold hydrolase [Pseudomonadota bacterium]
MRKFARPAALISVLALAACGGGGGGELQLAQMGSFHVGGRDVTVSGQPVREVTFTPGGVPARVDPNGTFTVEQAYVQFFIPSYRRSSVPILLMHGGGLSGVSYETTPDGREGWVNYFVRRGWSVYNADAVERGRAGWSQTFTGAPVFLAKNDAYERFRIGAGPGSYAKQEVLPGSQFPVEAYDVFLKQLVPRWTTTDDATVAAYVAAIDRICPCVLLAHSQAGQFVFRAAEARPDKIRAIVAVEPAGFGDPANVERLKSVPVLAVYGDFIDQDARWPTIKGNGIRYYDAIRAVGGNVTVVDLPQVGIRGNSHMMMMDKNNAEIAGVINRWLGERGLWR